jgi:hypothetical protein
MGCASVRIKRSSSAVPPFILRIKENPMKKILLPLTLSATLTITGCANMSSTQQRTLSGAAVGTAAGALIGGDSKGALIGAGVGAASGYIYDKHKQSK